MEFPVKSICKPLFEAVDNGKTRFVVAAPTGSGKSTAFPVMLQEKLGGQVFVLQPRRVAARMLARSIEKLFDMKGQAGWHVRFDKHYDTSTKIVFLTEGILARMLLSNSLPENVSAIVFDEFHERNVYTDISLALALKLQETTRKNLKIVACSASVDVKGLSAYMNCDVFECSTRLHEIDIQYSDLLGRNLPIWEIAAKEFAKRVSSTNGNFLIFMPGIYEINKTISKILELPQSRGIQVYGLYGDMPADAQDKILNESDCRKVIVATNIAETSLTIEGVDCVIDSGLAKVLRYDFSRAVNTLLVEQISMASAIQRAGRAGRIQNGTAVRLWRKADEQYFAKYSTSEISRVDLSQIILWLKAGNIDLNNIALFENPSEKSINSAIETLQLLGAIDESYNITKIGIEMAKFPTSPRIARMFVEAAKNGCLADIAMLAGVLESGKIKLELTDERREHERSSLTASTSQPEEIIALCELAKANSFSKSFCQDFGIHAVNARKAYVFASDFYRIAKSILKENDTVVGDNSLAKCVLAGYPDRVCKRLNEGTLACKIVGGVSGAIRKTSKAYAKDVFVAMSLQENNSASGISVVADDIVPIDAGHLKDLFPLDFIERQSVRLDEHQKRVCSVAELCYKDLPLQQKISYDVDETSAAELLFSKIKNGDITLKNFGDLEQTFIERVNFISVAMPELNITPIDDSAKDDIFLQMCMGLTSYSDVKNANVFEALKEWLSGEQLSAMRYYLPESVVVNPKRKPVKIRYDASTMRAIVSASFKDLFGFDESSLIICNGNIKPTFEILAPNSRPVQTTQNLQNFWSTSWINIRKELKARYPKHFPPTVPY